MASDKGADKISLRRKRPCHGKLNNGKRKDDERLTQVATTSFLDREGIGSHQTDLPGQVSHNCQQTGDEQPNADVLNVDINIAPAEAWPPRPDIIISPDQRVHNRVEILNLNVQNEHHCGKLSIPVQ